jgi:hypothetical protein
VVEAQVAPFFQTLARRKLIVSSAALPAPKPSDLAAFIPFGPETNRSLGFNLRRKVS